jgi:predicted phage terminase large subunit-like protein
MANAPITPRDAAQALLRRRTLRTDFLTWCKYNNYQPAAHHRLLIGKLQQLCSGEIRRLAVFMPPGSAKSTYASILFPPFYMANHPKALVLGCAHTTELAKRWGRRVRNLIGDHELALGISLSDEAAADRWRLNEGGEYKAAGVSTGIAGFRADVVLIDDPVRSREDADSKLIQERQWEWYKADVDPRVRPDARWILIQCMTGDTAVLMADGREMFLRDVRVGDRVATYENGSVSASTVRNWINHGPDLVYAIKMNSGIIVKANARHPFLVELDGETKWRRTASLKTGDVFLKVTGVSTRALHAPSRGARTQPELEACAIPTTISIAGQRVFARLRSILGLDVQPICATDMGLSFQTMSAFSPNRVGFVPFASNRLLTKIAPSIGRKFSVSIIATTVKRLGAFFATTVISSFVMPTLSKLFAPPLITFEITRDFIVDVVECGIQDVFDIQVERTENFIANGLISHNTRWHEGDLAGRILDEMQHGGSQWEILSLPAQAEENDSLGRSPGEFLWGDDDYGYASLLQEQKATQIPRNWSALYQQRPTPESGDYFKAEWLKPYEQVPARETLTIYGASDYATTADGGDYTCHLVVGIDPEENLYVLDLWRMQATPDKWADAFCDLVKEWKPLDWAEETGQIKASVGPFLDKVQRERRAYVNREAFPTKGDKAKRAQSIRGRMAQQGLYVPMRADWYGDFRSELLSFPAGRHDDQVDALGLIGQLLDLMVAGKRNKPPPKIQRDGYEEFKVEEDFSVLTL